MARKKAVSLIKQLSEELLFHLGLNPQSVELVETESNLQITIQLPAQESGMLVGWHGQALSSYQLLLSLMIYNQLGEWQPITVDINGYLQERQQQLERLALNTAQKVKFSGQVVSLSRLSAAERRQIHIALADHPEVVTESIGEGRERCLLVKPRQ